MRYDWRDTDPDRQLWLRLCWPHGKEMFDYTYDKQKYSSQVKEMRDAGLNIGLMYGGIGGLQGTTGGTSGSANAGSVSGYSVSSDMGMATVS